MDNRSGFQSAAQQRAQADQPNRGDFTHPDALKRLFGRVITFGWLA